jgi:type IV pilus assembly protein PilQ
VSKRKQIVTSIVMGSAVTAMSVNTASAVTQSTQPNHKAPSKNLIAQTQPLVPNPKITIDGTSATPGVGLATPTMPRAVAPPVGDISVSNLDASTPQIRLDSDARTNLTLRGAPAREALELLARAANLNLAFADGGGTSSDGKPKAEATVSVNFRNEPVQNAFNYVLQLSGLEANRVGNTIFVGSRLPDAVRDTVVRTLRMNQVTSAAAANFLTTQGAETQIATTKVDLTTEGSGSNQRTVETRTPQILSLKAPDSISSSLVLRGLSVSTDERLNSVTLVGSPRKVEMASAILTRLDARRRQVALNVKIVDVNLSNANSMSTSLSFGTGNGFLSVDKGAAVYNYGGYNPPSNSTVLNSTTTPPIGALNLPGGSTPFLDYNPNANLSNQAAGNSAGLGVTPGGAPQTRPGFGTTANPYQPGYTTYTPAVPGIPATPAIGTPGTPGYVAATPGTLGTPAVYTSALPTNFQYPTKFLSTLQAQIVSGNGKILTDPTLVVQEGQKSTVNLTQEVFAGFKINSVAGTGAVTSTREPIVKQAGLIVDLTVNRIDDNGFLSVSVSPTVSSIGSTVNTADGDIALLQSRTLNSGEIRLRDGQTLILSGIIQESDRTSVTKVPILGDIPILGALFRSTNKANQRQEVVVLLTPQILNDSRGQVNFTPGADARMMINK